MEKDPSLYFTVDQLVNHINKNAQKVNGPAWARGLPGVDRTTSERSIRRYMRQINSPLPVDHYREDVLEVPIFGADAVEFFTGFPESIAFDYSISGLAKRVGCDRKTIRYHWKRGNITPISVERTVQRVPMFLRKETLDRWYSPNFEALCKPEGFDATQKRTYKPKPRDRSGRNQRVSAPGLVAALGDPGKVAEILSENELKLPFELEAEKQSENRLTREVRRPDPLKLAEDNRRLILGLDLAQPGTDSAVIATVEDGVVTSLEQVEPSPALTEPVPAVTVDALLQRLEGRLGKMEYRFLIRGVTQLKTDGSTEHEQIAFVNEYMKSLDEEADEYEGGELDD